MGEPRSFSYRYVKLQGRTPGVIFLLSRSTKILPAILLCVATFRLAAAQGAVRAGPEFRVNTYTNNYQSAPRVSHEIGRAHV